MFIFLRLGLSLLVLIVLLVVGSLIVGYLSQTTVMTVAKSIDGDTYLVEVWDIARFIRLRLTGTRCFKALPAAAPNAYEYSMGWTMPAGHYFTRRSNQAADVAADLKCGQS